MKRQYRRRDSGCRNVGGAECALWWIHTPHCVVEHSSAAGRRQRRLITTSLHVVRTPLDYSYKSAHL